MRRSLCAWLRRRANQSTIWIKPSNEAKEENGTNWRQRWVRKQVYRPSRSKDKTFAGCICNAPWWVILGMYPDGRRDTRPMLYAYRYRRSQRNKDTVSRNVPHSRKMTYKDTLWTYALPENFPILTFWVEKCTHLSLAYF